MFARDGERAPPSHTDEDLRPDARAEVARARGDRGFEVWILSGDDAARVARWRARRRRRPAERALGGTTPEDKAAWLAAHDRGDTLMVGDGINDRPRGRRAPSCSGTPAVDRPFLAARADFYLVTAGLAPVRCALAQARALRVAKRATDFSRWPTTPSPSALAYAGLMSPLLCAVFMPASSLTIILATTSSLSAGAKWKSSACRSS